MIVIIKNITNIVKFIKDLSYSVVINKNIQRFVYWLINIFIN